mmetsp:Transcript_26281/g.40314  ORF Transcript_26281/g.40314 Transcript_26281/m.40314 type:complete len:855 (-) Transcript_26281:225-2789(-)|eukprot:CAMPEP_0195286266 /NCGR_PEP_ID=MMETSP0707-20130614/3785_1 /TAXON_ID=33640 /ORGANISM="Asterionellopsis glacialis, Strain CCMP134" /LENGTH=854 /DNA_ID=CAMNT_0040345881 /DNA_START=28 /DNA_END=2592 /DNA_ORIENTATION=+
MSRWLSNVNSLLEKLDGQAETVAEETYNNLQDDGDDAMGGHQASNIESILAKRGLSTSEEDQMEEETEMPIEDEQKSSVVENNDVIDNGATRTTATTMPVKDEKDSILQNLPKDGASSSTKEQTPNKTPIIVTNAADTDDALVKEDVQEEAQNETAVQKDEQNNATMDDTMEQTTQKDNEPPVVDVTEESSSNKETTDNSETTAVVEEQPTTDTDHSKQSPPLSAPLPKTSVSSPTGTTTTSPPPPPPKSTSAPITATTGTSTTKSKPPPPQASVPLQASSAQPPPSSFQAKLVAELEQKLKVALMDARDAQKESRTLRRHVVSLNTQLDTAENEIRAQRNELERAAERFEKDRTRHKEEKENLKAGHAHEISQLKSQQEVALEEHNKRSNTQLENARQQLQDIEQRRMQEGGNWTKELEETVQREQQLTQRLAMIEDEKSVLLSQVSSLQAQQATLESRLDSVSMTADTAMEREREAEDRLDKALSIHARQLSQRQTRESELERTVADLGAALVVARNRELNRQKREGSNTGMFRSSSAPGDGGGQGSGSGSGEPSIKARAEAAEDELETVKAQLELERQRSETLQQELRDVSKERAEEESVFHARQLQHDRRVADMSLTISRLESNLRDIKELSRKNASLSSYRGESATSSEEDEKTNKQINSLSEEILRQQQRMGKLTSETSALKSRLQVALARAESSENALALVRQANEMDDMPSGSEGGNGIMLGHDRTRSVRRRGGGRRGRDSYGGSIRSAIRLGPGQGGDGKERIGKAVDVLDKFSVQTGKFLRYNPLARGAFLAYLLLLHSWTFLLLFFHAHHFENVHGDFGAGRQLPHGPHAMMQQHVALSNPSP